MATQIKISELPLANESALSLAADDRLIFNNDNVNTQTIKFANFVDAILEQNLTFKGNCSFLQPITGPNGGDIQVGLDDLVDVQFQNVTSGQVITYSGTQWINRDVKDIALQLDSLSVTVSDTPSGGGNLTYDKMTGEFTFTPAVTQSFVASSLSAVNSPSASGGGSLAYNPANAVFTFTPADAYTKAESYSAAEVDAELAAYAPVATTYTKTEVDNALGSKALADAVGVTGTDVNLGTFTGTNIPANQNVKQALQALSNALDTSSGIELTDLSVGANGAATATGGLAYDNGTGVFTYSPVDVSTFQTASDVANAIGAQTATSLRTLLGIKEGADAGGAGANSGELYFNTGTNTYVVAA